MTNLPQPVLIAVSGRATSEDKRRCARAGIDMHLTKPVDLVLFEQLSSPISTEQCDNASSCVL